MNYPLLKRGDLLPMVGVLQKLLNSTGFALKVDGSFGGKTESAVKTFQTARRLTPDGIVGETTWTKLTYSRRLPIVDCVDVLDAKIYAQRVAPLVRVGAQPLLTGGMQRGIQSVLDRVRAYGGNLLQLRLVGHGSSGVQAVSLGAGGFREPNPHTGKMEFHPLQGPFEGVGLRSSEHIDLIAPISDQLGPYGSIELHGCRVAAPPNGHAFVKLMANRLGVPVSAGSGKQPMASAFRIAGQVFTAFPQGQSLRNWCESRPDFAPMTLP